MALSYAKNVKRVCQNCEEARMKLWQKKGNSPLSEVNRMYLPETPSPRTAGNENTGLLKLIAIFCMIVDHVGVVFFPQVPDLRLIGRIAFPLYCWCVVVGADYTRNIWKYALRLLIVGLISQPCYMWALGHGWSELNIFATLLTGLLAIAGVQAKRWGSQFWAPILSILLACAVKMDYGWQGVALILLLYAARKNRPALAAVMIAFCLYWGNGTFILTGVFGIPLPTRVSFLPHGTSLFSAISRVQFWAILALPLMLLSTPWRIRMPKWVAYAVYPVHLLVIGLVHFWM